MTRFNPCWHFWPHFWMVLPSTAWISSRSMFSHMVGPSAWNDRSQQVKKNHRCSSHTWQQWRGPPCKVSAPSRWTAPPGAPPSSTKQPRCHWKQSLGPARPKTQFDIKKISPWSKHVLVYQELKAQKSIPGIALAVPRSSGYHSEND